MHEDIQAGREPYRQANRHTYTIQVIIQASRQAERQPVIHAGRQPSIPVFK